MIVDTSALVAVAFEQEEAVEVARRLLGEPILGIGTPTLVETGMILTARVGTEGRGHLEGLLEEYGIQQVAFTEAHWTEAVRAFERFGKGRHPARLNLGDCFTYATAKLARRPLLCVGDDFPKTDLEVVPLPPPGDVTD